MYNYQNNINNNMYIQFYTTHQIIIDKLDFYVYTL